jgi:hypothetical protein
VNVAKGEVKSKKKRALSPEDDEEAAPKRAQWRKYAKKCSAVGCINLRSEGRSVH